MPLLWPMGNGIWPADSEKRVTLRRAARILCVLVCAAIRHLPAQQAVSSAEHARLFQDHPTTANTPRVNGDGMRVSDDEPPADDGLGEHVILQQEPSSQSFFVSGDAGVFYTDNVALTPRNEIADSFLVVDAAIGWTSRINNDFAAQVAAHSSLFRYRSTSSQDFTSVGVSAGLSWHLPQFTNVDLFARYDFIEMFDRHSHEILSDHQFTIGGEKALVAGRFQTFLIGTALSAGLTEPDSAQRDQAGIYLLYRFQPTQSFGLDLFYRFAGQFYNDTGRVDRNQIWSATARYWFSKSVSLNALFSFTDNGSSDSAFDYSALSTGGGLNLSVQF